MNYSTTKTFKMHFSKNTSLTLSEEDIASIIHFCNTTEGHKKIDKKGRNSEYFTLSIQNVLVTIICDFETRKIITGVIETHKRHFN